MQAAIDPRGRERACASAGVFVAGAVDGVVGIGVVAGGGAVALCAVYSSSDGSESRIVLIAPSASACGRDRSGVRACVR
eukprot:490446-Pleurochrysis_carterae.AAC.1